MFRKSITNLFISEATKNLRNVFNGRSMIFPGDIQSSLHSGYKVGYCPYCKEKNKL